ncbi:MAG TPA: DegQ family serine endoprotease [Gammaproteobacteria bacterium]|nr:DegQ family serine endoprotease [Gammaproteobacteria bacterium]
MKNSALAAFFAAAALAIFAPVSAQAEAPPPMIGTQPMPSLAPMISQATRSVVNISTRGHVKVERRTMNPFMNDPFFRHFFGPQFRQPTERQFHALGSGVIVNADKGYILTNNHVVENADKITVILNDGREFEAKVVGKDPLTDIAVVQIKADNLDEIALGDSSQLNVGDFVVAIGNPFGLSHTATYGIVSGLGRVLAEGGGEEQPYQNFIQTDASINPGNSGGALVNLNGQLVGINTAIYSRSGGNIGIGFAIPVNLAENVMNQLIKYGEVKRGRLGVMIQSLTPELANALGVKAGHGAVVTKVVDGSAADKAGIKQGDVIVAVDDREIDSSDELRNIIGLTRPGTKVQIKLVRDGETMQVNATLGSGGGKSVAGGSNYEELGAKFSDIQQGSPLYGRVQGVVVTSVEPDGEAAEAGLRSGDVIIAVNRHPIKGLAQFRNALSQFKGTLLLTVRRDDGVFFTTIR